MGQVLSKLQLERLRKFADDGIRIADEDEFWQLLGEVSSPLEMFYLPWLLNWDDSETDRAIRWILASPLCDAGTALAIYWLSCPTDWMGRSVELGGDEWENEQIAFFRSLEARVEAMNFPNCSIAFDPRADRRHWNEDGSERRDMSKIPQHMKQATPGVAPASVRALLL